MRELDSKRCPRRRPCKLSVTEVACLDFRVGDGKKTKQARDKQDRVHDPSAYACYRPSSGMMEYSACKDMSPPVDVVVRWLRVHAVVPGYRLRTS